MQGGGGGSIPSGVAISRPRGVMVACLKRFDVSRKPKVLGSSGDGMCSILVKGHLSHLFFHSSFLDLEV